MISEPLSVLIQGREEGPPRGGAAAGRKLLHQQLQHHTCGAAVRGLQDVR